jgi:hypothetical protein
MQNFYGFLPTGSGDCAKSRGAEPCLEDLKNMRVIVHNQNGLLVV